VASALATALVFSAFGAFTSTSPVDAWIFVAVLGVSAVVGLVYFIIRSRRREEPVE
jgi:ABC-type Fe3+-siderophore transport system permease subunit